MALTKDQWLAIRKSWEYDPDEPPYAGAAKRAGEKFSFEPPRKQSVADRAKAEKWERMNVGRMASVNAAAQRKADSVPVLPVEADGQARQADGSASKKGADVGSAMSTVEDAENLRAQLIARHREEWKIPGALMQEALLKRPRTNPATGALIPGSVADAFEAAKLAKITAETVALKQAGERKAWGLDIVVNPEDLKNLSDEDLELIAAGKMPKR